MYLLDLQKQPLELQLFFQKVKSDFTQESSTKDIFSYITVISTIGSFLVFLVTLFFYSRTAQIITFLATLGFALGLVLYRLGKPFLTSLYMTTLPPLMFGIIIVLVGGNFNQGLGIATSTFLSFIVFRDHPKTRKFIIGFDLLMYIVPTIYVNIYGPLLGTINLAFDEIIVFVACLCWLSLTFYMYDEKKTRFYTEDLELKNKYLKTTTDELLKIQNYLSSQNGEMQKLNDEMALKTKQMEEFTYLVTHDLKAPINNINSIATELESILKNSNNKIISTYLNYLKTSSYRMSNMVDNILDHAKIGGSKFKNDVSLIDLLNNILEDFSERIKSLEAQIIIGNLPIINCYDIEFRLLFQNLLDNSLKFVPENRTPLIHIDCEESNGYYVFKISDNGIGIPENQRSNIFGAFQRIPTQNDYEGTGLGLYGCKKIVDHHAGQIWITSELNKGTTFFIKIPIEYAALDENIN